MPTTRCSRPGAIKLMADGVIESHTAAMLEPYSNRAGRARRAAHVTADALDRLVAELDRRGWQVMIHAIGDRAIRMALDAFERAAQREPDAGARPPPSHRAHRDDRSGRHPALRRARRDRVDAAVSRPARPGADRGLARQHRRGSRVARPGSTAASRAQGRVWRSAATGRSSTIDPLLGLHVAVNRTTPDGEPEGGWTAAERLSLRQAIDAYTRDAAWASFDEHRKGSLERDMLADIVVLTKDIFSLPPARLAETEVAVTIFDGKVVYQRSAETDN